MFLSFIISVCWFYRLTMLVLCDWFNLLFFLFGHTSLNCMLGMRFPFKFRSEYFYSSWQFCDLLVL